MSDVSSNSQSRLISKSSSSSSSFYEALQQPAVTVTAASSMFSDGAQCTPADGRMHWLSSADEHHDRLNVVATGDQRQLPTDHQLLHQLHDTPATDFTSSPSIKSICANSELLEELVDMKHDGLPAVDDYNLTRKDEVRSYVDLMTSGTVGLSRAFINGHVTDTRCTQ